MFIVQAPPTPPLGRIRSVVREKGNNHISELIHFSTYELELSVCRIHVDCESLELSQYCFALQTLRSRLQLYCHILFALQLSLTHVLSSHR